MLRTVFIGLLALAAAFIAIVAGFRLAAAARETSSAETLAPSGGRFVATREGRLFVSISGPAGGQAVMMTHGVAAWGGLWSETAAILAAHGYRVYAVDLPPFGFSDRPASCDYSRQGQARRLVALADALELKRPTMIGHSYGGGPAMEAVLQAPGRFSRIILVAPVLAIDVPAAPLPVVLRSDVSRQLVVALTATNPLATRQLLASFMFRKDRALNRYVTILQRPMPRIGTTAAVADWAPALFRPNPSALSARSASYRDLRTPLNLIWGSNDSVTPIAQGNRLHALAPDSTLSVMTRVGHMPQLEDPSAFQLLLLRDLARRSPSDNLTESQSPRAFGVVQFLGRRAPLLSQGEIVGMSRKPTANAHYGTTTAKSEAMRYEPMRGARFELR